MLVFVGLLSGNMFSQINPKAKSLLEQRGEIIIRFKQPSSMNLPTLTKMMSIDNYVKHKDGNEISAYLNQREFLQFEKLNINYEIISPPALKSTVTMCSDIPGVKNWNCYPTYSQYVQIMQSFATDYPNLCKLVEFGQSVDGHKLLAVKISDNVNSDEEEPAFLYTSTMHGNETTGFVLMLRFIDYLLSNYSSDSRISDLVNSTEIWINPLFNPDGTYYLGDNIIDDIYSRRFNSNGEDLNRNFPDPTGDLHPDGAAWQPETLAMIDFMKNHPFVFAANFHGGAEVVNYPWDAWAEDGIPPPSKMHPDDLWYQEISREYADTVHANSSNYMTTLDGYPNPSGITNGGDWYVVFGSRQDYVNHYLHFRETTIELGTKTPAASSLPTYWNYNYRSFLNYINRVHAGIFGKIVDQDGLPLHAKIRLDAYDVDSSLVYSHASNGMYYRMLQDGSYRLIASCDGYSFVDTVVSVLNHLPTELNLVLYKWPASIQNLDNQHARILKFTNPVHSNLDIDIQLEKPGTYKLELFDITGKEVINQFLDGYVGVNKIDINVGSLKEGTYFCKIYSGYFNQKIKFVKLDK